MQENNYTGYEIAEILNSYSENFNVDYILKRPKEEQIKIIGEFIDLLEQGRRLSAPYRGKEIKGKTREIVAKEFRIASSTAGKLISEAKAQARKKLSENADVEEDQRDATSNNYDRRRKLVYDRKAMGKLYSEGFSDKEIAEQIGCDINRVNLWRKENGLKSNKSFQRNKKIEDLYSQGLSVKDIAKEVGCSASVVYYWLRI